MIKGFIESFHIVTNDKTHYVTLEGFLSQDPNYSYGEDTLFEYYDLEENFKYVFQLDVSVLDGNGMKLISKEVIDKEEEILSAIKKSVLVPFYAKPNEGDLVGDKEYKEYRNARFEIISETKVAERKKAITSKFANIDLF